MNRFFVLFVLLIIITIPAYSKRWNPPQEIKIKYANVIINITNEINEIGMLKLYNTNETKPFLMLQIYAILYDNNFEKDVQDVYIKKAEINGDTLFITNELNYNYKINLANYDVKIINGERIIKRKNI